MGGGSFKQMVLGVLLVTVGVLTGQPWLIQAGRAVFWSGVIGGIGRLTAKKPSAAGGSTMAAQGRLETVRQPLAPRQVVYGRARIGGVLTYFETTTDKQTAVMVTTFTGHAVQGIRDVYFNDKSALDYGAHGSGAAAGGGFAGYATVYRSSGTEGASQPFADLVSLGLSWGADHLQRDCAKVFSKHIYSNDVWQTGLPQVSCVMDGVKDIIDPRLGSPTFASWHHNPALCVAHYLCADYGLNLDFNTEIDQATLIASANVCDERVLLSGNQSAVVASINATDNYIQLAANEPHVLYGDGIRVAAGSPGSQPGGLTAGVTYYAIPLYEGDASTGQRLKLASSYANALAGTAVDITSEGSGGITLTFYDEPRYRLNGAFALSEQPRVVIERMLASMAGKLVNSGGVWFIYAGAYTAPDLVLDEDDFAGPVQIQTNPSRRDNANGVKGSYVEPASRFQPVEFPPVTSATYLAEDGGERVWRDIDLTAFVSSSTQAQRLAKIELIALRLGLTVRARFKLSAFRMMTGSTVSLTNTQMGWDEKAFEVMNCTLIIEPDGRLEVDAVLRETDAAVFDWSVSDEQLATIAPNTNLPDPTSVTAPTGLTATQSALVWDTVELEVTPPSDAFVEQYQFEYRLIEPGSPQTGEWTVMPRVPDPYIDITRLQPRGYQFRAAAVNVFKGISAYTDILEKTLVPPTGNWNGSLTGSGSLRLIDSIATVESPRAMCWSPQTNEMWIGGLDTCAIHNAYTGELIDTMPLGLGSPQRSLNGMTYCPSNGFFYCAVHNERLIIVIDPVTRSIVATFTLTGFPARGGVYCPTNDKMYYGCVNSQLTAVIDCATNTAGSSISSVGGIGHGAFCPVNGLIYMPDTDGADSVKTINPATNSVVTTITMSAPHTCIYCPLDECIYVSNDDTVEVIDVDTDTIVASIRLDGGGSPSFDADGGGMMYCPESQLIYVIDQEQDHLAVISPLTRTMFATLDVTGNANSLLWVPSAKTVAVSNYRSLGAFSWFSF